MAQLPDESTFAVPSVEVPSMRMMVVPGSARLPAKTGWALLVMEPLGTSLEIDACVWVTESMLGARGALVSTVKVTVSTPVLTLPALSEIVTTRRCDPSDNVVLSLTLQ